MENQMVAESEYLACRKIGDTELYEITHKRGSWGAVRWPELVAFANAIIAANEARLDSQTPTLKELRERYPGRLFGVRKNVPCGPTFCDEAWIEGVVGTPHYSTEDYALRWLAAELAKVNE